MAVLHTVRHEKTRPKSVESRVFFGALFSFNITTIRPRFAILKVNGSLQSTPGCRGGRQADRTV